VCRAETSWCALPLLDVAEILRPLAVEPVLHAPTFVLGLSVIRGRAVPVVDLGRLLTGEASTIHRLVSVRVDDRAVALAVTEVLGTRSLDLERFGTVPPLLAAASEVRARVGMLDGHLLQLLDTLRLIEAAPAAEAGTDWGREAKLGQGDGST
jgi:purine-binding chemotaxis protein CheW